MQPITSLRNPTIKSLRALRQRKQREQQGRFLVEGIRFVEEALDGGAQVETLLYAPELLVSERARALVDRVPVRQQLVLGGEAFRSLSDRDAPQGIAAVVRIEERPLGSLAAEGPLPRHWLAIIAHQLSDPGNLGTIIRTADAAGAAAVLVVEPSVDLYDPQTVRATMGSLFALPIFRLADEAACTSWLAAVRGRGLPLLVVASSAHGRELYYDVDYDQPVALLVGSERHGLPASLQAEADLVVRLPMAGRASSLNVSAATAALVYEIIRQRQSRQRNEA